MDSQNSQSNITSLPYRQAADRIWEMAKEYDAQGERELAGVLYEISQEIHDLARSKSYDDSCGNNPISK